MKKMKQLLLVLGLSIATAHAEYIVYRRTGDVVVGSDGSAYIVKDRYEYDSQGNRRNIGVALFGNNGKTFIQEDDVIFSNDKTIYVRQRNGA